MIKLNKSTKIFLVVLTIFVIIYFVFILIFSLYFYSKFNRIKDKRVKGNSGIITINNKKIDVEIVATPELRYHGLSDRDSLCQNCGMLFAFPEREARQFVMRDMHFDLDMIWITDDEIIGISKNLPKEGHDPQEVYNSPQPVNKVLEVNSGFCDQNNINVGDKIEIYD